MRGSSYFQAAAPRGVELCSTRRVHGSPVEPPEPERVCPACFVFQRPLGPLVRRRGQGYGTRNRYTPRPPGGGGVYNFLYPTREIAYTTTPGEERGEGSGWWRGEGPQWLREIVYTTTPGGRPGAHPGARSSSLVVFRTSRDQRFVPGSFPDTQGPEVRPWYTAP